MLKREPKMIKKILQSKKVTILQRLYLIYIYVNSDEQGVHHDYLMNDAKNLNINICGLTTNRQELIKKNILIDLGSEPISSVQYATGRSQKKIKINFKEL